MSFTLVRCVSAHHVQSIQDSFNDPRCKSLDAELRHILWYRDMLRQWRLIQRKHVYSSAIVIPSAAKLTFVLTLHTSFETVGGFAEAIFVYLRVDELQYGNQAMLAFRVLSVSFNGSGRVAQLAHFAPRCLRIPKQDQAQNPLSDLIPQAGQSAISLAWNRRRQTPAASSPLLEIRHAIHPALAITDNLR